MASFWVGKDKWTGKLLVHRWDTTSVDVEIPEPEEPEIPKVRFEYTGDYTIDTDMSNEYDFYTLTSSGILTLGSTAQVWACGGGASGHSGSFEGIYAWAGAGGGGGYCEEIELSPDKYIITVGIGGEGDDAQRNGKATTINTLNNVSVLSVEGGTNIHPKGGNGGSGGSAAGRLVWEAESYETWESNGKGAGKTTYPFASINFGYRYPLCAGGGSGSGELLNPQGAYSLGMSGGWGNPERYGSNGSDGNNTYDHSRNYGYGGYYGGGDGGKTGSSNPKGNDGYAYGSAGGGAGTVAYTNADGTISSITTSSGGNGYQGVVMLLIPKEKEEEDPSNYNNLITKKSLMDGNDNPNTVNAEYTNYNNAQNGYAIKFNIKNNIHPAFYFYKDERFYPFDSDYSLSFKVSSDTSCKVRFLNFALDINQGTTYIDNLYLTTYFLESLDELYFTVQNDGLISENANIYIYDIKLEEGTNSTEWCPSKYDKEDFA